MLKTSVDTSISSNATPFLFVSAATVKKTGDGGYENDGFKHI